jgi:hypothetical protein
MENEEIAVRITETGRTMDVVVLSKRAERIEVVLGEGVQSVRCELMPTRNRLAYAGSAIGRADRLVNVMAAYRKIPRRH